MDIVTSINRRADAGAPARTAVGALEQATVAMKATASFSNGSIEDIRPGRVSDQSNDIAAKAGPLPSRAIIGALENARASPHIDGFSINGINGQRCGGQIGPTTAPGIPDLSGHCRGQRD